MDAAFVIDFDESLVDLSIVNSRLVWCLLAEPKAGALILVLYGEGKPENWYTLLTEPLFLMELLAEMAGYRGLYSGVVNTLGLLFTASTPTLLKGVFPAGVAFTSE